MNSINWNQILGDVISFVKSESVEILFFVIIAFFATTMIYRLADRYVHKDKLRIRIKKNTKYASVLLSILWLLLLYNSHLQQGQSLPLFIVGIFLAAVAISMRDVFSNIVGAFMIASQKGFKSGDRIHIGTTQGDVLDIGMMRTTLAEIDSTNSYGEQSTGRLVTIPNSEILTKSVTNYNSGFDTMWNEMSINVTFESDWQLAEKIITTIAEEDYNTKKDQFEHSLDKVRRDLMLEFRYLTPKVYVTIIDFGVQLTLRNLVYVRQRRAITDAIFREVLLQFAQEPTVELAYPTTRFYTQA